MQIPDNVGNYNVIRKIGSGTFGEVYMGIDRKKKYPVALKFENKKCGSSSLCSESNILKKLSGGVHVPKYRGFESFGTFYVLVMDLLGLSLENIFQSCGRKFSLKTVLMISDQLLSAIEYVHDKGIIHRDLKPLNMLFGLKGARKTITLIDFGLSRRYKIPESGCHISMKTGVPFKGTLYYCSINTHLSIESSRRDDMESIGYVLVYLLLGTLPWKQLKGEKTDTENLVFESKRKNNEELCKTWKELKGEKMDIGKLILDSKQENSEEELCKTLPIEFCWFLKSVKSLGFEEKPKYSDYRSTFRNLFHSRGFSDDKVFDWTK